MQKKKRECVDQKALKPTVYMVFENLMFQNLY